jgi:DNA recombination protein RmuC
MTLFLNILIILIAVALLYFLLKKDLENFIIKNKDIDFQKFLDLQNKITENFSLLKKEVEEHLDSTLKKQEKIMEYTFKIEELTRDIKLSTEEMKTLKEILSGPKERGFLGERMLEEILKRLPSNLYEKQYPIGTDKVDFVIKINDILIPIDSKFPVSNFAGIFSKDERQNTKKELIKKLKAQIESISKKYILPSKGTVEFALMYLANESIYYELLTDKDFDEVWEYAREKSVFITSPKNFEVMCSSLLLLSSRKQISENINQILNNLHQLEKDLVELANQFEKSYNQLRYSFSNIQEFERILNRFIFNFRSLIKKEEKIEDKIKEKILT